MLKTESDELDQDTSDEENDGEDPEANYYKENIFNKEDFYLYRGVLSIYACEYESAIEDLQQCSVVMHQNKVLYPKNQFGEVDDIDFDNLSEGYESPRGEGNNQMDDNMSSKSSQTDLSDVGLCSLNIHEFSFNTALCLILSKDYQ